MSSLGEVIVANLYNIWNIPYMTLREVTLFTSDVLAYIGRIVIWILVKLLPNLIFNLLNYIWFFFEDLFTWAVYAFVYMFYLIKLKLWPEFIDWIIRTYYATIEFTKHAYHSFITATRYLWWVTFHLFDFLFWVAYYTKKISILSY